MRFLLKNNVGFDLNNMREKGENNNVRYYISRGDVDWCWVWKECSGEDVKGGIFFYGKDKGRGKVIDVYWVIVIY